MPIIFLNRARGHVEHICLSQQEVDSVLSALGENRETFARYIIDRNMWTSLSPDSNVSQPMRPVNADSFLLISAGPDGLYGTNDDVSNMAAFSQ